MTAPVVKKRFVGILALLGLALLGLPLLVPAGTAIADAPPGYYDTVDLSSPEVLRQTVHNVIDGHVKIPYTASSTDTWNVLEKADEDPYNSGRILDVYQNRTFPKYGAGNNDYNREHTWPNSYGFPDDGSTNLPYSDCHHLFLCDIDYNSARANLVYDDCLSGCNARVADFYDGAGGTNYYTTSVSPIGHWETWDGRKGDVARAMFYMDVRYAGDAGSEPDLILTDDRALMVASATGNNETVAYMGELTTLLAWHLADPVDAKEMTRNDWVHNYQGNRNPFIDHPEWVAGIFLGIIADVPDAGVPMAALTSVHPNPFNPETTVAFDVAQDGPVTIEVYGMDGRRVRSLVRGTWTAGPQVVRWDGRDDAGRGLASGAWFVRLVARDVVDTRKVLLLK